MDYLSVIQKLNTCHGPSGDERQIAATLRHMAEPYADECWTDTMGNLIVHKKGTGPKVMFAAHMDSIGLIATHIDKDGYISFGKLGGIHPESILHTPFRFRNGVYGVVSRRQNVEMKNITLQDLYLDIGAKDEYHARSLVQVGDTAVSCMPAYSLGTRIAGPYLDNRISCAAILEALGLIRAHTSDLYFVFTAQEELGLRGSKPAAYNIDPDYGIVVDVTVARELDDLQKGTSVLGCGAAIKVMDSSVICHPEMVEVLEKTALSSDIPCQRDVLKSGGTDGGSIHLSRAGVITGGISVPCRYVHSPVEMVEVSDVSAVAHLIAEFSMKTL
ncbi:MAG: M20/M25/M40 family metallo-hydrolase [Ruminiclostridium sp.]|nr:M20/M25/M40 family metallo-hydrolase [Ruminiclostridium sp.]